MPANLPRLGTIVAALLPGGCGSPVATVRLR